MIRLCRCLGSALVNWGHLIRPKNCMPFIQRLSPPCNHFWASCIPISWIRSTFRFRNCVYAADLDALETPAHDSWGTKDLGQTHTSLPHSMASFANSLSRSFVSILILGITILFSSSGRRKSYLRIKYLPWKSKKRLSLAETWARDHQYRATKATQLRQITYETIVQPWRFLEIKLLRSDIIACNIFVLCMNLHERQKNAWNVYPQISFERSNNHWDYSRMFGS